jgi:type IV pilus assembly protein PilP
MIGSHLRRGGLLLAVALLGACSSDMDELRKYCADVRARKTTHIPAIPPIKQYEAFAYVVGDRRDPFVPALLKNTGLQPDLSRNKEPLEEFPLDSLKLVGLINFKGATYALIRAPDGIIHRVTVGNHMGQNFGKITLITPTEVSLVEIVADGFGGFKEQPASLAAE